MTASIRNEATAGDPTSEIVGPRFTPGPWRVERSYWKPWDGAVGVLAGEDIVCWTASGHGHEADDARLIAVAPEMFFALLDLQMIAEMNVNDICASLQEGHPLDARTKMELARWGRVGDVVRKALGNE